MFREILPILYDIDSDCCYMFRQVLAILWATDIDGGKHVSANVSHSVAY